MIQKVSLPNGTSVLVWKPTDLHDADEWARAMCVSALGPDRGMEMYQSLRALDVLSAWAKKQQDSTLEA